MNLWALVDENLDKKQSFFEDVFRGCRQLDCSVSFELADQNSPCNNTLLHYALVNELVEPSKALLAVFSEDIDFSLYDINNRSVLVLSLILDDETLSLRILEKTPKDVLLKKDTLGITPLQAAVYFGMDKVFREIATTLNLNDHEVMVQLSALTDKMCESFFQSLSIDGRRDKAARHSFFLYEGRTFSLPKEYMDRVKLVASSVTPEIELSKETQCVLVTSDNLHRLSSLLRKEGTKVNIQQMVPNPDQLTGISFANYLREKRHNIIQQFKRELNLDEENCRFIFSPVGLFSLRGTQSNAMEFNLPVTCTPLFYMSYEGKTQQVVLFDDRVPSGASNYEKGL